MVFPTLKRLLTQKQSNQDFSKYLGEVPQTRKQRLLEDCKKNDVSIYIDNQSEQSSGNSAELRGVGKLLAVGSRMCIGGCFWFVPRKMVSLQKKRHSRITFGCICIVEFPTYPEQMVRTIFPSSFAWHFQRPELGSSYFQCNSIDQ